MRSKILAVVGFVVVGAVAVVVAWRLNTVHFNNKMEEYGLQMDQLVNETLNQLRAGPTDSAEQIARTILDTNYTIDDGDFKDDVADKVADEVARIREIVDNSNEGLAGAAQDYLGDYIDGIMPDANDFTGGMSGGGFMDEFYDIMGDGFDMIE